MGGGWGVFGVLFSFTFFLTRSFSVMFFHLHCGVHTNLFGGGFPGW